MAANMYRVGGMYTAEGLSHTSTTMRTAGLCCSAKAPWWALMVGQQRAAAAGLQEVGAVR